MEHLPLALLAAIVGFIVGVLVNILTDSLPAERVLPLLRYPDGSPRPLVAASGAIAFLTGKRVNAAGSRLPWRQPLVETGLALAFGLIALNWPNHDRTVIWFVYLALLALVMLIDLEHRIVVTPVVLVACLIALGVAVIAPESDRDFLDYLIGGGMGLGLFLVMFWGGGVFSTVAASVRGQKLDETAFGLGDVYLATMCGLMIGWQAFIFAAIITVFLGAIGGVAFLVIQTLRGKYSALTPLPYGPYIVVGTIIMMLWREEIGAFLRGG